MMLLIGILARWRVPEWLRKPIAYASAIIAALGFLWAVRAIYDHAVIARHEAKVQAQVAKQVSAGNDAAAIATVETKTQVEKVNDDARTAAIGSDDPLRAGLGSLRTGAAKNRPAAH